MIQGRSNFVYRVKGTNEFVSYGLKDSYETSAIHVDIRMVRNDVLDLDAFKAWSPDYANASFILEDGKYRCGAEVEKMSKSKYNVVNPDDIVEQYGADTLRMYEMFLGPLEQSKPWNTNGIDGVSKFLRKFWRLFHDKDGNWSLSDDEPSKAELKALHATIKKSIEDIERLSFNTSVSAFMVCVNDLTALKCNKRSILESLVLIVSPYAPHICEELWMKLGHEESISQGTFPKYNPEYLVEDSFEYPVMINGKLRTKLTFGTDLDKNEIEAGVLADEVVKKWLDGKSPKRMVIVPKKIVNVVV
jgi:leucyl-tRNA synthetase